MFCDDKFTISDFLRVNEVLPQGISVLRAQNIFLPGGRSRRIASLMSLYGGSVFRIYPVKISVKRIMEKLIAYRELHGDVLDIDGSSNDIFVQFLCRHDDSGRGNIKKILTFCGKSGDYNEVISQYRIVRIGMIARDKDGGEKDYFEYVNGQSR